DCIEDSSESYERTGTKYRFPPNVKWSDIINEGHHIEEFYNVELNNRFAEVITPYIDELNTTNINNCKNIENFAGNFLV
ncbi:hypothetical protein COBT_004177, partial [Conglomerata obtusa]